MYCYRFSIYKLSFASLATEATETNVLSLFVVLSVVKLLKPAMAKLCNFTCLFLLLALLFCQVLFSEGRDLNGGLAYGLTFRPTSPGHNPESGNSAKEPAQASSFRSITLGPSPGIGHHTPGIGHPIKEPAHVSACRPTSPDQSPGISHPSEEPAPPDYSPSIGHRVKEPANVSGLTPKSLDHSPPIGHPVEELAHVSAFRPTTPGHSPGSGN
ncbi:hypothetical protein NMG60_11008113 [Bertholletia excelsa]